MGYELKVVLKNGVSAKNGSNYQYIDIYTQDNLGNKKAVKKVFLNDAEKTILELCKIVSEV